MVIVAHILKISTLLQNSVVEGQGDVSRNVRQLKCAGNDNVFRMVSGR
jgi:hypothetical protein